MSIRAEALRDRARRVREQGFASASSQVRDILLNIASGYDCEAEALERLHQPLRNSLAQA